MLALVALNLHAGEATKPMTTDTNKTELATFGGGCFWCMEAVFQMVPGVTHVTSGYAGGKDDNPSYKQVCSGETGHAEVIQVTFDPAKVSYGELLKTFFEFHDPTTLNRQGADRGTQYRSIILFSGDAQKSAAEKAKQDAQKDWPNPVVTEIVPLKKFYPAEDYHQNYFRSNPTRGYCAAVVRPKVEKMEKKLKAAKK